MKKIFLVFLCVLSLFTISSCCDDVPPDSVGVYVRMFNKENFSVVNVNDILPNINVAVRNDSISSKPIAVKNGGMWGEINIFFTTETRYRDWIQVPEEEFLNIYYGRTNYYLVINDPDCSSYNQNYETKYIHFSSREDRCVDTYLSLKNN